MALEQITQAVHEAARTEADLILKSAKKAAEETLASARKAAEQDAERRYQTLARAVEEEFARKLIQLQGEANKELLTRKNALLRKVFAQARERILALPAEEYGSILKNLLENTVTGRGGKLRIHASDKDLFEGLTAGFNEGRPEDQQVCIDKEHFLSEQGGFIFVSDKFQVDQTLGTLLENIEYGLAPQISAELFSGQK
ncbi:MAG: hypothetical protein GXY07_13375 [Candidatus Hydrogenedentes bacterium]|nr:hypothetical protein [Candidatus Hydrogenedentota bacterium]